MDTPERKREPDSAEETGKPAQDPAGEDILATAPPGRDLGPVVARPPRRGRLSMSTSVLIVGVVLAAGFVGGMFVGRSTAPEMEIAIPEGLGDFPEDGQFPGGGAGAGGGDGFTVGTVTRVEGDTIYVETPDGETVTVSTSQDTEIQVSEEGTVDDLPEGSTVVVEGGSAEDGSIEATSVTEGGFGPGGGLGGGDLGANG